MKIWEVLHEKNVGKMVSILNLNEVIGYNDRYLIDRNGQNSIGLFRLDVRNSSYRVESIQSTDIMTLEFKIH